MCIDNLHRKESQIDALTKTRIQVKKYVTGHDMCNFFSNSKTEDDQNEYLRTPKYVNLFLIMYQGYINNEIENKINETYGSMWKEDQIGYIISVEKILMDSFYGSKENLKKLLFGSGILEKENQCKKARIFTHGEGILPPIQQINGVELTLKSYFILAQLHDTYIYLSLHEVVKISSLEESESSIIVQDKTIQIENVYEKLCKHLWNHIKSSNAIDYCPDHIDKKNVDIYSLENYKHVLIKLKVYLLEIVSNRYPSVNLKYYFN